MLVTHDVFQAECTIITAECRIEYPRKGVYAVAFISSRTQAPLNRHLPKPMLNCFVPTTPNPTSGFYLLISEEEVIDLHLSVEDAFKLIMSAGLVSPGSSVRSNKAT